MTRHCPQACYIDWTLSGATKEQVSLSFPKAPPGELLRAHTIDPNVLRYFNRHSATAPFSYYIGDNGKEADPSIDNQPTGGSPQGVRDANVDLAR